MNISENIKINDFVIRFANANATGSASANGLGDCMTDTGTRTFYHGIKAELKIGDMLQGGYSSNYTERRSRWIYFSETVFAATWGAELAKGEGPGRIYVVEPTGPFMDDPNVTDKKFPGNPTKSYRSQDPLRVVSEHLDWQGHTPEEIQAMKDFIADKEPIDD